MSLNSLLSIARTALTTHQRAVGVTAHNIANSQTPGYTRQRLDVRAGQPLRTPWGTIGSGVTDVGVTRLRDTLLDAALRREAGQFGSGAAARDLLGQVEGIFGEPSDRGLAAELDAFFAAFADLSANPSNLAARTMVQHAGEGVARQLGGLSTRLGQVRLDAIEQLRGMVHEVNAIAQEIAALNGEIRAAGGAARSAPDLVDRRDQLLDELAALAGARAIPRADGSVAVSLGQMLLVDGTTAQEVELRAGGGEFGVGVVGSPNTFQVGDGRIAATATFVNTTFPEINDALDLLAAALVDAVNTAHQAGFTATGATGVAFFDPGGVTAQTIRLSDDVATSPLAIAAGATATPGDGTVAAEIAALRTTALVALSGANPGDFYLSAVSTIGVLRRDADRRAAVSDTLVAALEMRRSAISGVSVDEELVTMISHQQAFSAASRIVTVADELMQDLLRMV